MATEDLSTHFKSRHLILHSLSKLNLKIKPKSELISTMNHRLQGNLLLFNFQT
jgi:hypothetical protein